MSLENWQTAKLSSIASVIDCPHSTPKWTDSGYFVIRNWNVREGRLDLERASYTDKENFLDRIRRAKPEYMDLVLTREAPMGEVCMIPQGVECCLGQRVVLIKPKKSVIDPRFLLFSIQSPFVKNQIMSHEGTGSTVSNLRIPAIENLNLVLPDLPTQRRIADILSALDDKIELNRQTNATLEAMAQAIFKEWFIDFNYPLSVPRLEGLEDYHDYTVTMTARQSSNQENQGTDIVESELGLIPAGWRVGSILEIANLLSGGTPSTRIAEYWNGEIDWVSAKDVSNSTQSFILETERKITQAGVENSSTKLLPELTTIVTARGSVGNYCILARSMTMNQTNYGLKAQIADADYFVFFALGNLIAQLQKAAYGTIFDTVTTRTFEQSRLVIPPRNLIQQFHKAIAPIMQAVLQHLEETIVVTQIRDNLLPKLMRGEIEV